MVKEDVTLESYLFTYHSQKLIHRVLGELKRFVIKYEKEYGANKVKFDTLSLTDIPVDELPITNYDLQLILDAMQDTNSNDLNKLSKHIWKQITERRRAMLLVEANRLNQIPFVPVGSVVTIEEDKVFSHGKQIKDATDLLRTVEKYFDGVEMNSVEQKALKEVTNEIYKLRDEYGL